MLSKFREWSVATNWYPKNVGLRSTRKRSAFDRYRGRALLVAFAEDAERQPGVVEALDVQARGGEGPQQPTSA